MKHYGIRWKMFLMYAGECIFMNRGYMDSGKYEKAFGLQKEIRLCKRKVQTSEAAGKSASLYERIDLSVEL